MFYNHGQETSVLLRCQICAKLIYKYNTVPGKILACSCVEKKIPKFVWKSKRPRIIKIILKKKVRTAIILLQTMQNDSNQGNRILAEKYIT